MTIDAARGNIGRAVLWHPPGSDAGSAEEGTITSVSSECAYVRFGRNRASNAVDPAELTLLAG